jgi:hypothetical protein
MMYQRLVLLFEGETNRNAENLLPGGVSRAVVRAAKQHAIGSWRRFTTPSRRGPRGRLEVIDLRSRGEPGVGGGEACFVHSLQHTGFEKQI